MSQAGKKEENSGQWSETEEVSVDAGDQKLMDALHQAIGIKKPIWEREIFWVTMAWTAAKPAGAPGRGPAGRVSAMCPLGCTGPRSWNPSVHTTG